MSGMFVDGTNVGDGARDSGEHGGDDMPCAILAGLVLGGMFFFGVKNWGDLSCDKTNEPSDVGCNGCGTSAGIPIVEPGVSSFSIGIFSLFIVLVRAFRKLGEVTILELLSCICLVDAGVSGGNESPVLFRF